MATTIAIFVLGVVMFLAGMWVGRNSVPSQSKSKGSGTSQGDGRQDSDLSQY